MEYTALYRKLRPKTFSEIIGQEHIVKTLLNQLVSNRVSHAYLFCGTRGTGKTSTAKIFAKAINCENSEGGEPCGRCEMCLSADSGRSFNIFEIDAASNNGVENIRELREEVNYPPAAGKYKVYIIDEVHMLSVPAFNALLKTLEEPPAHVVFILATTDPQKVPVTIVSRCQRFDFKRIGAETIAETLKKHMENEGVAITDEALRVISGVCDGAMRDALSILDRCISYYYGEEITKDKVLEVIGSADKTVFFELTDSVCGFDTAKSLKIIEKCFEEGRDLNRFVGDFVVHLRNVLLAKQTDETGAALDYSAENIKRLKQQAAGIESARLIELISGFSELLNNMKYSDNVKIMLEVFIVRVTNPAADTGSCLVSRVEQLEKLVESGALAAIPAEKPMEAEKPKEEQPKIEKAAPKDIDKAVKQFGKIRAYFKKPPFSIFVNEVKAGYLNGDKVFLVCDSPALYDFCLKRLWAFEEAGKAVFGCELKFEPILKEDYDTRHKTLYGRKDGFEADNEAISDDNAEDFIKKVNFNVEIEE
ncbi:MAG: DNA polymerase III subunit gamma/tau [Clostridiales bacterium]|nr:DNA polymerase III subunit gamma/tau [Clostridiales bacterium]